MLAASLEDLPRQQPGAACRSSASCPPPRGRRAGPIRIVTEIVSDEFLTGNGPSIPVLDGDVIRVFSVASRVISIACAAMCGLREGWITAGMRVSDALRLAGGVRPDVYLGQILIARTQPDSSRLQLRRRCAIRRVLSSTTFRSRKTMRSAYSRRRSFARRGTSRSTER